MERRQGTQPRVGTDLQACEASRLGPFLSADPLAEHSHVSEAGEKTRASRSVHGFMRNNKSRWF